MQQLRNMFVQVALLIIRIPIQEKLQQNSALSNTNGKEH